VVFGALCGWLNGFRYKLQCVSQPPIRLSPPVNLKANDGQRPKECWLIVGDVVQHPNNIGLSHGLTLN
jgi:hypothetical protein